jgi:malate dehydrogenase (quinone)
MEFSDDPKVIRFWCHDPGTSPRNQPSRLPIGSGTDVDFEPLTHSLLDYLTSTGASAHRRHTITNITRQRDGLWRLRVVHTGRRHTARMFAPFVFVGAGGRRGKPPVAGSPDQGFGGFPVGGEFLRTTDNQGVLPKGLR